MALDPRIRQLLMAITDRRIVPQAERSAELAQPGQTDLGADSPSESRTEEIEQEKLSTLGESFEAGLRAAARVMIQGRTEVRLDANDPLQNSMADGLIQFLVRSRLAAVRNEEPEPGHYVYYVSVDWQALRRFASAAGVNLDEAVDLTGPSRSSS